MSGRGQHPAAPIGERVRALEEALAEKELVPEGFLEKRVDQAEENFDARNGARVVARAWIDPAYRARLLADGTAAAAELGFRAAGSDRLVVLEDSETVHHAIVCTQCSCTAWSVIGLPPDWYKSPAYRARLVREPRALLREMGLDLPTTSRCASGIRAVRPATWCCRCARWARKAGARRDSPRSSLARR